MKALAVVTLLVCLATLTILVAVGKHVRGNNQWWVVKAQLASSQSAIILEDHMRRISRLEHEVAELGERNPVGRIDTTYIRRRPFLIWDIPDTTHNLDTLNAYRFRLIPRGTVIPQTRRSHEKAPFDL